jgi:hypothetical protein
MSDHLKRAERYRRKCEESIALAKAAISNKARAQHYAAAERYLSLAEAETKVASRSGRGLRGRLQSLFQRSRGNPQLAH